MHVERKRIGTRTKVRLNKTDLKQIALEMREAKFLGGVTRASSTREFALYVEGGARRRPPHRVECPRTALSKAIMAKVREEYPLCPSEGQGAVLSMSFCSQDSSMSGASVVWYENGEGEGDEEDEQEEG